MREGEKKKGKKRKIEGNKSKARLARNTGREGKGESVYKVRRRKGKRRQENKGKTSDE